MRTLYVVRGLFDLILIDADHTYDGVKADFAAYGRRAPMIALHDFDGARRSHVRRQAQRGRQVLARDQRWADGDGNHQSRLENGFWDFARMRVQVTRDFLNNGAMALEYRGW